MTKPNWVERIEARPRQPVVPLRIPVGTREWIRIKLEIRRILREQDGK
jgi:hypothetical protein